MATWPVAVPRVTPHGAYAYPRPRRAHHGLDLGGARGTVVVAPEALTVLAVGRGLSTSHKPAGRVERGTSPLAVGVGLGGYGPAAVLALGASGVVHVLGHLEDAALPAVGAQLGEGAAVGTISRVRHVHWEVRRADAHPWPRASRARDTYDPAVWLSTVRGLPFAADGPPPATVLALATRLARATSAVRAELEARAVGEVGLVVLVVLGLALGRRRSSSS